MKPNEFTLRIRTYGVPEQALLHNGSFNNNKLNKRKMFRREEVLDMLKHIHMDIICIHEDDGGLHHIDNVVILSPLINRDND
jgi:hypothetical protein